VVCVCSKNNNPPANISYPVLYILPKSKLQFINPIVIARLIWCAKKHKATHIILEHPYHAIAGWILKKRGFKIVTHCHNIEFLRFKKMGKPFWRLLKMIERWVINYSNLSLYKTEFDINTVTSKLGIDKNKCLLVPYGVEKKITTGKAVVKERLIKEHMISDRTTLLLFNGTLDYLPNAKAVEGIFAHLVPALNRHKNFDYTIFITGKNSTPRFHYLKKLKSDKIIMIGHVTNVGDYFTAADIYINPVSEGGGIQTKTLEALSYNLNVVCWDNMLSGIDVSKTDDKVFAVPPFDWEQFAIKIIESTTIHNDTPGRFYQYYSFKNQVIKLTEKLLGQA
jgi:polysaccharide biosynthesis protein PslH